MSQQNDLQFEIRGDYVVKSIHTPDLPENVYSQSMVIDRDTFMKCYETLILGVDEKTKDDMFLGRAIRILKKEKECMYRNFNDKCNGNCDDCSLQMDNPETTLAAYTMVIDCLEKINNNDEAEG